MFWNLTTPKSLKLMMKEIVSAPLFVSCIVELNWAYCEIYSVKPYYFLIKYEYYVPAVLTTRSSLGHVSILLID